MIKKHNLTLEKNGGLSRQKSLMTNKEKTTTETLKNCGGEERNYY